MANYMKDSLRLNDKPHSSWTEFFIFWHVYETVDLISRVKYMIQQNVWLIYHNIVTYYINYIPMHNWDGVVSHGDAISHSYACHVILQSTQKIIAVTSMYFSKTC